MEGLARPPLSCGQLTRCFSAVAELLVMAVIGKAAYHVGHLGCTS